MGAAVLMMKAQVGLGVLSLPATFHTLGLVPGLIVLVVIAVLWTCESKRLRCAPRIALIFVRSFRLQTEPTRWASSSTDTPKCTRSPMSVMSSSASPDDTSALPSIGSVSPDLLREPLISGLT